MPYFSSTNSTCLGTEIIFCWSPTKLKFQCTLLSWPYWYYLLKLKQCVGIDQILTSHKEEKTSIVHVSLDSSGTVLLIYSANSKSFLLCIILHRLKFNVILLHSLKNETIHFSWKKMTSFRWWKLKLSITCKMNSYNLWTLLM